MTALILSGHAAVAQSLFTTPSWFGRLTVRPSQMATATSTEKAGVHWLATGMSRDWVYVPPQCAGAQRCPLMVLLPLAFGNTRATIAEADKYGMIALIPGQTYAAPARRSPDDPLRLVPNSPYPDTALMRVDSTLQQVLQRFAIEPGKIALVGSSNDGATALFLGRNNLDVFSRIAVSDPAGIWKGAGPPTPTTEFFVVGGLGPGAFMGAALAVAAQERQEGHRVTQGATLRGHAFGDFDFGLICRWLAESWGLMPARPDVPAITASDLSITTADSAVLLTAKALDAMVAFWREQPRLRTTTDSGFWDLNVWKSVRIPTGHGHVFSVVMPNMTKLAQDRLVASALKRSGLTARQHDAYFVALTSAELTRMETTLGDDDYLVTINPPLAEPPVPSASVIGKNVQFLRDHPAALRALKRTDIWGR